MLTAEQITDACRNLPFTPNNQRMVLDWVEAHRQHLHQNLMGKLIFDLQQADETFLQHAASAFREWSAK